MTGKTETPTQRWIGLLAILLVLAIANAFALQAPEEGEVAPAENQKISTLSDYLYNKDFKRYEEIAAVADCQKKIDQLTAFMKERPISRMLLYAAGEYMSCIVKIAGDNPDKIIQMTGTLNGLVPTDQAINAEAKDIPVGLEDYKKEQLKPTRQMIWKSLAVAYYQKQDFAKSAEYGERAYAATADTSLAELLFDIYSKQQNEEKMVTYGSKMMQNTSLKDPKAFTAALQLADMSLKKNNTKAATELFTKLMDAYGNSVPPNYQESKWNETRALAYDLMGREAYKEKNYTKAESLLQKSLTFNSRGEGPYYYLGMCRWNVKDQKGAITYFARCYVLNKSLAAKAKDHLDQLHKATYPTAPAGAINDIISQARKDLGI